MKDFLSQLYHECENKSMPICLKNTTTAIRSSSFPTDHPALTAISAAIMSVLLTLRHGITMQTIQDIFLFFVLLYASLSDLTYRAVDDSIWTIILAPPLISISEVDSFNLPSSIIADKNEVVGKVLAKTEIEKAEQILRLTSPDLKSISFYLSQLSVYADAKYRLDRHILGVNTPNADVFMPIEETKRHIGEVSFTVPFCKEVKEQLLEGRLYAHLLYGDLRCCHRSGFDHILRMAVRMRRILKNNNGEGYIDITVMILVVAFVLIFSVNMVSLVALNQNMKTVADPIIDYATIKGTTDIDEYITSLKTKTGIDFTYSFAGTA